MGESLQHQFVDLLQTLDLLLATNFVLWAKTKGANHHLLHLFSERTFELVSHHILSYSLNDLSALMLVAVIQEVGSGLREVDLPSHSQLLH